VSRQAEKLMMNPAKLSNRLANRVIVGTLVVVTGVTAAMVGRAQEAAKANQPVLIQRQSISLTSAETYRVAVELAPVRSVTITAEFEGTVETLAAKVGRVVDPDFELLRIDDRRSHLLLTRARASKTVADTKLRLAQIGKDADQILLAEAETKLAEVEVSLAEYDLTHASVRAPYKGTVLEVHVSEGERINPGQPLITFGDLKQVKCRLPVDRAQAKIGATASITVEAQNATGKIGAVLPLPESVKQLRDLAVSVAVAEIEIDNAQGRFQPGQRVFSDLIPKFPVARVPLESVKTAEAGGRIVQVLRENVVRNVAVTLHGQIGDKEVFVSGSFSEHDEVIRSTSVVLADGMAVKPSTADRFANATSKNGSRTTNTQQKPSTQAKPNAAGF
jgi:multidrug resistance efflux pump